MVWSGDLTLHGAEIYENKIFDNAGDLIGGTGIHIFLFITSMPAWIVGLMVSSLIPVPFAITACIMQIILYGILGKIMRRGINYFN